MLNMHVYLFRSYTSAFKACKLIKLGMFFNDNITRDQNYSFAEQQRNSFLEQINNLTNIYEKIRGGNPCVLPCKFTTLNTKLIHKESVEGREDLPAREVILLMPSVMKARRIFYVY